MRGWIIFSCLVWMFGCTAEPKPQGFVQAETIQLSDPVVTADSILFRTNAQVNLEHGLKGAKLLYTLDGSDVIHTSAVLERPLSIEEDVTVQVRAYHPQFKPSEQVQVKLRKLDGNLPVAQIESFTSPKPPYDKGGWGILTDEKKGSLSFRDGNKWLGFQKDTLKLKLKMKTQQEINKVIVSTLCDQNAWIFDPIRMEVLIDGQLAGTYEVDEALEQQTTTGKFWDVGVVPRPGKKVELIIISASALPQWHSGSGNKGWLFIDEILVR